MCDRNSTSRWECGLGGSCSDESFCVCRQGWRKASEFVFNQGDESLCSVNTPLLTVLYLVLLISAVFGAITYKRSAKKKSQLLRLIPFFLYSTLCAIIALAKLIDPNLSFSNDIIMAILFGLSLLMLNGAIHVFLYKYIRFQYKAVKLTDRSFLRLVKVLNTTGVVIEVTSFLAMCLFIAVPVISSKTTNVREDLTRLAFALKAASPIYYVISSYLLISKLMTMMKRLSLPERVLQKSLSSARTMLYVGHAANILGAIFYIVASASSDGLRMYTYGAPINLTYLTVGSIIFLYARKLPRSNATGESKMWHKKFSTTVSKSNSKDSTVNNEKNVSTLL